GSGSTRPPGSFFVSSMKRDSSSSALEQAVSPRYAAQTSAAPRRSRSLTASLVVWGLLKFSCMLTTCEGVPAAPSARRPRMVGVLPLVRFAGGDLLFVEIAVGLRRELEAELIVGVLGFRPDLDIVQRDDARQRCDAAHELTELVIAAREADLDGQLGVEIALLLALRLKQLLLEPRCEARLGDVDEQIGHLRLAGELAQQRAE